MRTDNFVEYTGKPVEYEVLLADPDQKKLLEKGVDYKVSYENNVEIGTGTVIVEGIGDYCGTIKREFRIWPPRNGSKLKISRKEFTYNGKVQKPDLQLIVNGNKVISDLSDYAVQFSGDCINVGSYFPVVWFYRPLGAKGEAFRIIPQSTSFSKIKRKNNSVTLKWKRITKQADGYQIQYCRDKAGAKLKKVKIRSAKTNKTTIRKLKPHTRYTFRIRTYKNVRGKTYYSKWSKWKKIKTKQ